MKELIISSTSSRQEVHPAEALVCSVISFKFFLFTLLILTGYSQNTKENSGVVIIKDKKIDDLIKNKSNIRRISTAGYRVQIFFSTDKDKVQDLRMKFIKQTP